MKHLLSMELRWRRTQAARLLFRWAFRLNRATVLIESRRLIERETEAVKGLRR